MPKRTHSTIKDIANAAGVSVSTVSRVLITLQLSIKRNVTWLSRRSPSSIINQTHLRKGCARHLHNYRRTHTGYRQPVLWADPDRGVEQGLHGSPYQPIFASGYWRADQEHEALNVLTRRQLDGLIVIGGQLPDQQLQIVAERIPLIAVGRTIEGIAHQCIQVENFQGSFKATRYLINLGHRHIAHVAGIATHPDAIERYNGYCQALRDANIEIDPALIIEGGFTEEGGLEALKTLLTSTATFTAIVAANDQMAYGILLGLSRHRIRVPDDVSLVGFDNQSHSAYTSPPLTTVEQPTVDMGIAAAKALLNLIHNKPLQLTTLPTQLIIRELAMACAKP